MAKITIPFRQSNRNLRNLERKEVDKTREVPYSERMDNACERLKKALKNRET